MPDSEETHQPLWGGASFSPTQEGKRAQNEGIPPRSQCTGGFLSARLEGLISIFQVPPQLKILISLRMVPDPQLGTQAKSCPSLSFYGQIRHSKFVMPSPAFAPVPFLLELHPLFPPLELQNFSKWVLSSVPAG